MNRTHLGALLVGLLLVPRTGAAQGPRFGAPMLPAPPRAETPIIDREKETSVPQPAPMPTVPASSADAQRDLFRASPGTFAPRYDRLLTPEELGVWFPHAATVWPVWVATSPYAERRAGMVHAVEPTVKIVVEHVYRPAPPTPPAAAAVPLPAVAVPPPPASKKTLYVIPGCYAGDKPPRADQLRAGCSLKNVRTISPVL